MIESDVCVTFAVVANDKRSTARVNGHFFLSSEICSDSHKERELYLTRGIKHLPGSSSSLPSSSSSMFSVSSSP